MHLFQSLNRRILLVFLSLTIAVASGDALQAPLQTVLTPDTKDALDRISAASMRGHLSFIASDELEGRNTPSRGLDLAAEYIAAQFRRSGLEPAGDDGYFQIANWSVLERDMANFAVSLDDGTESVRVNSTQVSISFNQALKVINADVIKVDSRDSAGLDALAGSVATNAGKLTNTVIVTELPAGQSARADFLGKVYALKPALLVTIDRNNPIGTGGGASRLIDPENRPIAATPANAVSVQPAPVLTLHAPEAVRIYDALNPGTTAAKFSMDVPAFAEKPVRLRNVIGILRGSDPVLRDTYVFVTAHYDHLGMRNGVSGDQVFNGANDDGSGTVSVIEIASALSTLKVRPKRSIVFMTVWGEEKGLLGSRYYGRHPTFPLEKTVADINLEQVGRTDSTEGPQIANASMTGFDFSEVGSIFKAAGELTGITVYKHERNSDSYFGRSDNQALADQGVPAHTICVAFSYPDYHGLDDRWEKVDYVNMAGVDRMVALGLVMIANNPEAPKWMESNTKTARYVAAWKMRHIEPSAPIPTATRP